MAEQRIENVLIAMYTRNEEYHDSKDHLIWLVGSVYLAFSLAAIAWLFDHRCLLSTEPGAIVGMLISVFVIATIFVGAENWQKCQSLKKTELFEGLIRELDQARILTHEELIYRTTIKNLDSDQRMHFLSDFFKNGWPGALLLLAMLAFFLAQIWVIATKATREAGTMTFTVAQVWIWVLFFGLIIGGIGIGLLIGFGARVFACKDRFLQDHVIGRLERIEKGLKSKQ